MTPREINKLFRAVYGWEYEATVICGVWLGLRRSEQCGLQWRDINLKTGVVMIRRGLQVIDREIVVTDVKTHRSLRPNVLPKVAVQRLREIKRQLNPKPADWLMSDPNPENYARKLRSFTKKQGYTVPLLSSFVTTTRPICISLVCLMWTSNMRLDIMTFHHREQLHDA